MHRRRRHIDQMMARNRSLVISLCAGLLVGLCAGCIGTLVLAKAASSRFILAEAAERERQIYIQGIQAWNSDQFGVAARLFAALRTTGDFDEWRLQDRSWPLEFPLTSTAAHHLFIFDEGTRDRQLTLFELLGLLAQEKAGGTTDSDRLDRVSRELCTTNAAAARELGVQIFDSAAEQWPPLPSMDCGKPRSETED